MKKKSTFKDAKAYLAKSGGLLLPTYKVRADKQLALACAVLASKDLTRGIRPAHSLTARAKSAGFHIARFK